MVCSGIKLRNVVREHQGLAVETCGTATTCPIAIVGSIHSYIPFVVVHGTCQWQSKFSTVDFTGKHKAFDIIYLDEIP